MLHCFSFIQTSGHWWRRYDPGWIINTVADLSLPPGRSPEKSHVWHKRRISKITRLLSLPICRVTPPLDSPWREQTEHLDRRTLLSPNRCTLNEAIFKIRVLFCFKYTRSDTHSHTHSLVWMNTPDGWRGLFLCVATIGSSAWIERGRDQPSLQQCISELISLNSNGIIIIKHVEIANDFSSDWGLNANL